MKRIYLFVLFIFFSFQGCTRLKLEDLILVEPYVVSRIDLEPSGIILGGDKLYVFSLEYQKNEMDILDVSNPCSTFWVAKNIKLPETFSPLAMKGSLCFGFSLNGITVVDFSSYTCNVVSQLQLPSIYELIIVENLGFAVGDSIFYVIDISSPESLKVLGEIKDTFGWINSFCSDGKICAIFSNNIYNNGNKKLYIIDVSNPSSPVVKCLKKLERYPESNWHFIASEIHENYIFATSSLGLLHTYDISEISLPKFIQAIDIFGAYYSKHPDPAMPQGYVYPFGIYINYPYLYVCSEKPSLAIFDISNPRNLRFIGGAEYGDETYSVAFLGEYALLSTYFLFEGSYLFTVKIKIRE